MNEHEADAASTVNPYAAASSAKKKVTLFAIFIAVFGSLLQSSTLSTMLPLAANEIGGVDYYSLASAMGAPLGLAAMPLWGYIAYRSPHLKPKLLIVSMLAGVVAILMRFFAPNMMVIVVAMLFWGLVSPGIFVVGFTLIRDMYDQQKAGTYLGVCSTLTMLSMLVGPVVGGALMTVLGWRSLNLLILPFMAVAAILPLFGVNVSRDQVAQLEHGDAKFDVAGTIALLIGLGGLILYLSVGTSLLPFFSTGSNILLAITVVAIIVLVVVIKKKQGDAIIPAPAMKNRNVLAFALANLFANFSNMAVFFFLPSFIIYVLGGTGTDSGLVMACFSVAGIFLGPVFGRYIGKTGSAKATLSWAGIGRIIMNVVLIFVLASSPSIVVLAVLMLVFGVVNSLQSVSFSAGPQVQLPADLRIQGNSVIQCGQSFGAGVGTAVYTVIIGVYGITGGMPIALAVAAVFGCLTLVAALMLKKID